MGEKAKDATTKIISAPKGEGLEGLRVLSGNVPAAPVDEPARAPRPPARPAEHNLQKMEATLHSVERASSAAHDRIAEIEKALGEPSPLEEEIRKLKSRVSVLESARPPKADKGNGVRLAVGGVGGGVGGAAAWQLLSRGVNMFTSGETLGTGLVPTLIAGVGGTLTGLGAAYLTREE